MEEETSSKTFNITNSSFWATAKTRVVVQPFLKVIEDIIFKLNF